MFLDYDEYTGITETVQKKGNKIHVKKTQDVEPILNLNQEKRSSQSSGWKGDMHRVASIPMILIEQWWQELGSNPLAAKNRQWLIAKLNSQDYLKLRTKEGRI